MTPMEVSPLDPSVRLVRDCLATPKVLVVAAADATALCQKNGLTLTQLLRPFGRVPRKGRCTSGSPSTREREKKSVPCAHSVCVAAMVEMDKSRHQVLGISVEFVDETRFVEERVASLLGSTVGSFKNAEEPYGGVPLHDREDVSRVLAGAGARDLTPWFSAFAMRFGLSIGSVEHENFGHPVACVVAISSACVDVVSKMKETFETIRQNIRSLFPEGLAPASLQAQFVLLHDDHEGPTQAALDKLRELQSTFGGQHCHLLKINSLDLMQPHAASGLTTFLSESDLKGLEDFARHVTVALIVPKLMETLQISSKQLDAKKKTFSDTLATWWGGGGKKTGPTDEVPPGSGLKYAPTSVVALYRKVADAAFMLQYYDLAYSAYRACAKEVKKTQDEWLAGCVEMATICSFLTNSAPRDFEADLEKATKFYSGCAGMQRFSLRCSIVAAALCKAGKNYLRAGAFFADYAEVASSALVAALLQEQASLCLLYLDPPRFRRLAFRLVFAARKFITAGHYLHALRCYRYAEGVYRGHEWRMIDDHLRFNLARQLASHDRHAEALELFQLLLCDSVASRDRQASYLRELLFLATVVPPPRNAPCGLHVLAMPLVEQTSARMIVGSRKRANGNGIPGADDDLGWVKMEKELSRFGTKLHRRSMSLVVKTNRPNDCAVGEPACFEVKLSNPLAIHLQLSAVTVVAFHEPLPGHAKCSDDETFQCETYDVFLTATSSTTLLLKMTPTVPGLLKVRGLRCSLFGTLPMMMPINPPVLRSLKQNRMGVSQDESRALDLSVCSPMPLLECEFSGPAELLSGQIVKCCLRLSNSGKTEMRNVRIKTSHPAFMHFSISDDLNCPPYGACSAAKGFSNVLRDLSVWEVPIKTLGPGENVNVFLWLRGASEDEGSHVLRFLMYYEPVSGGGHRLFRFATPLKVVPLLRLSTQSWPMPGSVDSYLVGLTVQNAGLQPVSLDQVACGSFQWTASSVDNLCDLDGLLQPGHAAQLAFKLGPRDIGGFGFEFQSALLRKNAREMNVAQVPLLSFVERESSEKMLSGPEDLQVEETFVESALQIAVLWSKGNEWGMQTAVDVSSCGDANLVMQSRKAAVVTPGMPVPPVPLRFGLSLPKSVEHDFAVDHLCLVSGSVVMHNSTAKAIVGTLHAHPPPSGAHSRMCYFWSGLTLQKFQVEPHSTLSLTLDVGFNSTGTFNVDRFSVTVGEQVMFPAQSQQIVLSERSE